MSWWNPSLIGSRLETHDCALLSIINSFAMRLWSQLQSYIRNIFKSKIQCMRGQGSLFSAVIKLEKTNHLHHQQLSRALVLLRSSRFGFKRISALMFPWEEWNKPLLHPCAASSLISSSGSSTLLGVSRVIMKHNQKNNKAVHVSEWSCSCAGAQECLKHNCTVVSYAMELPISLSLIGN